MGNRSQREKVSVQLGPQDASPSSKGGTRQSRYTGEDGVFNGVAEFEVNLKCLNSHDIKRRQVTSKKQSFVPLNNNVPRYIPLNLRGICCLIGHF